MQLNANTRISAILKYKPEALEKIIALSPKFEKLRNPFLRKLMAGRVSISTAARMGDCEEEDFYNALKPLGFETTADGSAKTAEKKPMPEYLKALKEAQIRILDVLPILNAGKDPLKQVMEAVNGLKKGEALKIINSFEPTPLLSLLGKKGFHYYIDKIEPQYIETWFFSESTEPTPLLAPQAESDGDWGKVLNRFGGNIIEIDVRHLQMPQPMMTILETLEILPADKALFVYHKRIPVFLIPELEQRNFEFRSREISENEIHLLIFRS